MAEFPEYDDEQFEGDEFLKSVSQIERLQLPKRSQRRRAVYLGEQISCCIDYKSREYDVQIIDITSRGVSVVLKQESDTHTYIVGEHINIVFNKNTEKSFQISGIVSNLSNIKLRAKTYDRIGIKFDLKECFSEKEYKANIKEKLYSCSSEIRPQAYYQDPFFYNEIVLLKINHFSSYGIDMTVSERCKSLLPFQPIELEIFIPGRGSFKTRVQNQNFQYKPNENSFRVYMSYMKPSKSFLEKISEYLIMFSPKANPNVLRKDGFIIGDLNLAYEQNYSIVSDDIVHQAKLAPGLLAPPITSFNEKKIGKYTRRINCKIGPNLCATLGVIFCGYNHSISKLKESSHKIPDIILMTKHIELVDLYISPHVNVVDFLVPLIKNVIRIGIQSNSRYLLLECSGQYRVFLEKIGFVFERSQVNKPTESSKTNTYFLMSLNLKNVVLNKEKILTPTVWKQVYQDLYQYFRSQVNDQVKKSKKKPKK